MTNWQSAVERTVTGLGYDLVDAEKSAGGLLRVYIDHPAQARDETQAPEPFITVDDCEKVTRQLQHVLEVENCAYERLEVSSPGLDRPLKKAGDYARFTGEQVEITLKLPFKGRKKFSGRLVARDEAGQAW
ncbi:MAG: ribosome maturation factor RimP, partial [Pseudomonadota bacterium]|nr:ribosome maturation factor RimP [Pseudomonadota bacterium]